MRSSATDTRARELTVRDPATTGVFTTLYMMFVMTGGMFFTPNPVLTFWMPTAVVLPTGPVYLLLTTKIPKYGPLIVLGVVEGVLPFVTDTHWMWAVACVVFGVVADLLASAGGFTNKALNFAVFVLYSLSPIGSYPMLWINPGGYTSYLTGDGAERAYMDTMMSMAIEWMPPAMIPTIVVCAIIGDLMGMRPLRKQLEKTGATA